MLRVIMHESLVGRLEMTTAACEVAAAKNMLTREYGSAPSQLVFGEQPKLFGEMYTKGGNVSVRLQAADPVSAIGRRFRIRLAARKLLELRREGSSRGQCELAVGLSGLQKSAWGFSFIAN